jgi:hypothetical protein
MDSEGNRQVLAGVEVKMTGVLEKYDGDLTDDEREAATPTERVVVEDGVIIRYEVNGELQYDAEAGIGAKPNLDLPIPG